MTLMQIGIIIAIVVVGFGMILALTLGQGGRERAHAMAVIKGGRGGSKSSDSKKTQQDQRRAEIARKLKEQSDEAGKKKKDGASIADRLMQAGMSDVSVKKFWISSLILGVVLSIIAKLCGAGIFVTLMIFITGFLGLPRLILKKLISRRQKKFLEEFADALEAMIRLLKAGMPVSEAISMVGREFEGPVGEEMAKIYETQKIGVPLEEACQIAIKRMPITEMQMFATGIAIQAQTGASLSDVLGNLSGVIRSRFKLKRKVKSLSSEAKSSAAIIGSLPILISTGIYFINPAHIMVLFDEAIGRYLLIGAVCWMGVGILVMKIMINFKV